MVAIAEGGGDSLTATWNWPVGVLANEMDLHAIGGDADRGTSDPVLRDRLEIRAIFRRAEARRYLMARGYAT